MTTRGFTTTTLHCDRTKPIEHGAIHKPIHNSAAFGFADVTDLVKVFQGDQAGFVYGRQGTPTTAALEEKITRMEQGIATATFGSGMGAISATLLALLRSGDHLIASRFLFGNTTSLFETFAQFGIAVTFVDATEARHVEAALRPETRMVFVETIANPCTQVADLEGIGALCRCHGLLYVVDNTITTPYLFRPQSVGASLTINSLTKYIGGHGNALGGAVTETGCFDWSVFPNLYDFYKKGSPSLWGITQIRKKGLRDAGATLGPEAAHHLAVGSETLALRMDRIGANAQRLADFLQTHAKVKRVYYPGLPDHPQHEHVERDVQEAAVHEQHGKQSPRLERERTAEPHERAVEREPAEQRRSGDALQQIRDRGDSNDRERRGRPGVLHGHGPHVPAAFGLPLRGCGPLLLLAHALGTDHTDRCGRLTLHAHRAQTPLTEHEALPVGMPVTEVVGIAREVRRAHASG